MANDERIPCLDDMCTGTINERGLCNYCGARGPASVVGAASAAAPEAPDEQASAPEPAVAAADAAFDPEERVPCADDMCTGTINERGVCNYCGRAAR